MLRYVEIVRISEKNGLMLIAVAIVLFYWVFDVVTEGQMLDQLSNLCHIIIADQSIFS